MMLIKIGMQPIGCNSALLFHTLKQGEFVVGNHVTVLKMKQFHFNALSSPVPITLTLLPNSSTPIPTPKTQIQNARLKEASLKLK